MNALKQINGSFDGNGHCLYEGDQMERLISAIEKNTSATGIQNDNFKYITKYLLIVVCVIAIGQKALEAARDIWGGNKTVTETK